jgi:[ribosomal protein S5]-alanine N-acetyltransferase
LTSPPCKRIKGRGVFLRPAELDDFHEWVHLRMISAEYLSRVEIDWKEERLPFAAYAEKVASGERAMAGGHGYPFLIFRRDGWLVGGLTLGPIVQRVARLGTWIGTPYVGKGYALGAVEAALGFAFHEAGLERVEAITLTDNLASIRVLEFHGFSDTGRREVYAVAGVQREHAVYSRAGRLR